MPGGVRLGPQHRINPVKGQRPGWCVVQHACEVHHRCQRLVRRVRGRSAARASRSARRWFDVASAPIGQLGASSAGQPRPSAARLASSRWRTPRVAQVPGDGRRAPPVPPVTRTVPSGPKRLPSGPSAGRGRIGEAYTVPSRTRTCGSPLASTGRARRDASESVQVGQHEPARMLGYRGATRPAPRRPGRSRPPRCGPQHPGEHGQDRAAGPVRGQPRLHQGQHLGGGGVRRRHRVRRIHGAAGPVQQQACGRAVPGQPPGPARSPGPAPAGAAATPPTGGPPCSRCSACRAGHRPPAAERLGAVTEREPVPAQQDVGRGPRRAGPAPP